MKSKEYYAIEILKLENRELPEKIGTTISNFVLAFVLSVFMAIQNILNEDKHVVAMFYVGLFIFFTMFMFMEFITRVIKKTYYKIKLLQILKYELELEKLPTNQKES